MRNIFVEGVRSAFIRIIRLITYIVIGLIIFYIIGIFTSKKAHALVAKGSFYQSFDNVNSMNGTLSTGSNEITQRFTFNTPITLNGSDYVLFRFSNFDFTYQWDYQNDYYSCQNYNISHGYVQGQFVDTSMTCSQWQYNDSNRMIEGTLNISGLVRDTSTDHGGACYVSDDMKGFLICNLKNTNMTDLKHLDLTISQSGYNSVRYNVGFFGLKYWYNNDSTEIINGLTGVQQAQQQTITIVQQQLDEQEQQNQYMQSDNVTSSTTSMTTSITTMTDDISQRLSGASELTQIVLAPLALLTGLATDTCAPLVLQVPFVNYTANLPCMKPVFNQYFNGLYSIFTTIISAIMTYWISVKTFSLIKDILDCDNDRIEVIDL